eukprot:CAMPEP_0172698926 /NCGR_PEP_ID=MMETSP1074-20121228/29811_1 /TAXON_ID=2916 /ORGANISM="Ceratium fusus, Strain PA161109" /LENGTH=481 /DNA_ID=CAMNT_0013520035 /DNA_START=79 /DNA_END=1520 /DNA_ORIENTATION=+
MIKQQQKVLTPRSMLWGDHHQKPLQKAWRGIHLDDRALREEQRRFHDMAVAEGSRVSVASSNSFSARRPVSYRGSSGPALAVLGPAGAGAIEDLHMVSGLRHWTASELRIQEQQSRNHVPYSAREPSKREQEKLVEEKRRRAQCKVELEQYQEKKKEVEAAEREAEQAEQLAKQEAERKREGKRRARQRELLKKMEEDGQRSQEIERMKCEDEAERARMRFEAEQQKEQYRHRQKKQLDKWLMDGADDTAERRINVQAKHADILEQTRLRHQETVDKNVRQVGALQRMQQGHERIPEWKEALRGGPAEPSRGSVPSREATAKPSRHSASREPTQEARHKQNEHEVTRRPPANNDWRSRVTTVSNMYGLSENQTSAVMHGIRGAGRMAVYCSPAPRPRPRHPPLDPTLRGSTQIGVSQQSLAPSGSHQGTRHPDGEQEHAKKENSKDATYSDNEQDRKKLELSGGALLSDKELGRTKSDFSG